MANPEIVEQELPEALSYEAVIAIQSATQVIVEEKTIAHPELLRTLLEPIEESHEAVAAFQTEFQLAVDQVPGYRDAMLEVEGLEINIPALAEDTTDSETV